MSLFTLDSLSFPENRLASEEFDRLFPDDPSAYKLKFIYYYGPHLRVAMSLRRSFILGYLPSHDSSGRVIRKNFLTAVRLADAAVVHFWDWRRESAKRPPMDGDLNLTLASAEFDALNAMRNHLMTLEASLKHLPPRIDLQSSRPRKASRIDELCGRLAEFEERLKRLESKEV